MTYKFIVNTEEVNEYGYRVLTDGIDYAQFMRNPVVLFMHTRDDHTNRGSEVIGKVVKLYVEGTNLIAEIEFDMDDEFAAKIAGKVEREFIRMASMYADVKECSTEPEYILPGQSFETVTKCKLVEISVVDIGGNDGAIRLSKDGKAIQLNKIENKQKKDMSLKTIALALALIPDASEETVLGRVNQLKLDKETAEARATKAEDDLKAIKTAEATVIVDKAISLGLIPDALKTITLNAFMADFEGQKVTLSQLIQEKEQDEDQAETHQTVKEVVLGGKGKKTVTTDETFDYLQKHDPVKLGLIRDKEPAKYEKLADDYAKGVRHTNQ